MKHSLTIRRALAALLVVLAGCSDALLEPRPEAPAPRPVAPRPAAPTFPPVSDSAAIYDRTSPSFIPGSSRYVIYDDGTFALQYVRPDWGFFEYPGRYSRTDSVIRFVFEGWSVMGPWLADGIVQGKSLIVTYNEVMFWSDFEDGVYVLSSDTQ